MASPFDTLNLLDVSHCTQNACQCSFCAHRLKRYRQVYGTVPSSQLLCDYDTSGTVKYALQYPVPRYSTQFPYYCNYFAIMIQAVPSSTRYSTQFPYYCNYFAIMIQLFNKLQQYCNTIWLRTTNMGRVLTSIRRSAYFELLVAGIRKLDWLTSLTPRGRVDTCAFGLGILPNSFEKDISPMDFTARFAMALPRRDGSSPFRLLFSALYHIQ